MSFNKLQTKQLLISSQIKSIHGLSVTTKVNGNGSIKNRQLEVIIVQILQNYLY